MKKVLFLLVMVHLVLSANAQSFLNDSTSSLVKVGSTYMLGATPLTTKQVGQLYQSKCPDAYKQYLSARACTAAGATIVAIGGLELVGASAYSRALNARGRSTAYSVGTIITGTGLIVMLCAPLKYGKAIDIYNDHRSYRFSFAPSVGAEGVSLAFRW